MKAWLGPAAKGNEHCIGGERRWSLASSISCATRNLALEDTPMICELDCRSETFLTLMTGRDNIPVGANDYRPAQTIARHPPPSETLAPDRLRQASQSGRRCDAHAQPTAEPWRPGCLCPVAARSPAGARSRRCSPMSVTPLASSTSSRTGCGRMLDLGPHPVAMNAALVNSAGAAAANTRMPGSCSPASPCGGHHTVVPGARASSSHIGRATT